MIIATAAASAAVAAGAVVLNDRLKRQRLRGDVQGRKTAGADRSVVHTAGDQQKSMARAEVLRERLEKQLSRRQKELDDDQANLEKRKANLDRRFLGIKERNDDLAERFAAIKEKRSSIEDIKSEIKRLEVLFKETVEQSAGETADGALEDLTHDLIDRAQVTSQKAAKSLITSIVGKSEYEAKRLIDVACQRYGMPLAANRLVSTVNLPNKKNQQDRVLSDGASVLKAIFEETEVEFVDQGEGIFFLQAPDPYTREVGRLAYEKMIRSGDISEAAAKKFSEKSKANLDKIVRDAGRRAARILHLKNIHPDILHLVGKLLYRTSYTQNQWQHAIETAHLCGMMAEEMGLDIRMAHRSALLHDIGKVLWAETEACGSHAVSGAAFAADHGEDPDIVHPIAAHHNDEKPSTPLAHLVAAADALSGARPGARRETLESYTQRVDDIEAICERFRDRGVRRAYVIQGGREVRLEVTPKRVNDQAAIKLATDIATTIEDECIYPGQIKVIVMRETVSSASAN
ncbi:MAG: HDIG domain-containing metalloprotein [Myxococcota bacterium]|nr:HDIG domain-containing metalloprotein [Myxococcota bacterium]